MNNATKRFWRSGLLLVAFLAFAGTATAQRTVTLRLNTATAQDTVRTTDEIQVRGCLEGCVGDQADLPGGDIIAWNDNTTLKPMNIGGDYWETSFEVQDDTMMAFKFYSQLLEDDAVGGWEDGDDHTLEAGTGDTTFTLHYFRKGTGAAYDWRPFESKEDTVGVWFRVYMATPGGEDEGYDPAAAAPNQVIGVRGDSLADGTASVPPLNWGVTNIELMRESSGATLPGYNTYSGVAYYPASFVGLSQAFKFVIDGDAVGWEGGNDRNFTVPSSDSTLQWVYFGGVPPTSAERVMSDVIFTVDLDPLEEIGIFRKSRGDTIEVRGTFNSYGCVAPGDNCLLQEVPGSNQFERAITMNLFPQSELAYKFFLNFDDAEFQTEYGVSPPTGWEEGFRTGVDRTSTYAGTATQDLGIKYFNEVKPANVIPDGVSIDLNISVDMSSTSTVQPFDPVGGDSVFIQVEDPIWAFTQGLTTFLNGTGDDRPDLVNVLTDPDTDGVYTGTVTVTGPTYGLFTWRYQYGQRGALGDFVGFTEPGQGLGTIPGRNRAYWMLPNSDGSWPASYDLTDAFQPEDATPLPFTSNVVSVEQIGSDLPETVTLLSNYPNPFRESTSFDYTVTQKTDVRISVYNVVGQHVATVVDAVQPSGTYRATFEAKGLASGTYFYRLEANGKVISRPMILVR